MWFRRKRSSVASPRFYVYVSESKVDMLLMQIDPGSQKKVTAEFGINFKLLSAKHTQETVTLEDKFQRVAAVEWYIRNRADFGTVDAPAEYFGGTATLRWGPYGYGNSPLVWFAGSTERTILGLGGSSRNVIGSLPYEDGTRNFPYSQLPGILDLLWEYELDPNYGWPTPESFPGLEYELTTVRRAAVDMTGPATRLEFMAKRLLSGPSPSPREDPQPDMSVLLGLRFSSRCMSNSPPADSPA